MCRRTVEIKVILFNVFAVIAFTSGETKQSLLENGIFSIPQSEGKTDHLMAVGDTRNAVFIPAVRFRARVIMRQVVPCGAVSAIVFADRSPRALAQIGSPALPMHGAIPRFFQSLFFCGHNGLPL